MIKLDCYTNHDWSKNYHHLLDQPIMQFLLHFYEVLTNEMILKYVTLILFCIGPAPPNTFNQNDWLLWNNFTHRSTTKCKNHYILKKIPHSSSHQNIRPYHSINPIHAKPISQRSPSRVAIHLCLLQYFALYRFLSSFVGYLFHHIGIQNNFEICKAYSYKVTDIMSLD